MHTFAGGQGDFDSPVLRLSYTSLTTPASGQALLESSNVHCCRIACIEVDLIVALGTQLCALDVPPV
eukprot:1141823-Pelagomonas_calceolata.AAC.2